MQLSELAEQLVLSHVEGNGNIEIKGIQIDSRKVDAGDLFICLRGFTVDGHTFARQAVERGAVALVVEERQRVNVPQLIVPDTRRAMAMLSSYFYGNPSESLHLIGVTGTNGKTTTTHLIHHILTEWGKTAGLIGTIHMRVGKRTVEMKNTTPEALDLQRYLYEMVSEGTEYAAMEVSSHALDLGRVRGCRFRTAVFTNLTQDHLDYHGTMDRYREAKSLLFSQLGNSYAPDAPSFAVLNADDENSAYFAQRTAAQVVTYGIDRPADVQAKRVVIDQRGTSFDVETFQGNLRLTLQLVGKFSVYNALAALTVCLLEGVPLDVIQKSLESVTGVSGRFERVDAGQDFTVLVDYAHTPDSLENVLQTVKEFAAGRIFCVVGCGGDRDRTKRPIMAQIAVQYSDLAVLTSDNPRTEDPARILNDMVDGIQDADRDRYTVISDRREAIHYAVGKAKAKDIVLIAGKGHETYQEINGKRYNFDDREVAREALQLRGKITDA